MDRGIPATTGGVVSPLAESYRVLAYDRRGHIRSQRTPGQGSIREDVADLAALIEHLGLAPAWVAGNSFGAVVERIASGDHAGAAEQFVETVALGPGTWIHIPPEIQKSMIENAPTFLDEANDPEALAFDTTRLKGFSKPALLTMGDQSPPTFAPVVRQLSAALPHAEVVTIRGAGHVPHSTHPDTHVDLLRRFITGHDSGG